MEENLIHKELKEIYLGELLPNQIAPCSLYFYYKGKYLQLIKKGDQVSARILEKMRREEVFFAYIQLHEENLWKQQINLRYQQLDLPPPKENSKKLQADSKSSVKRAQFLQMAQSCYRYKGSDSKNLQKQERAILKLRTIVFHPYLDWYFQDPPVKEIFDHSAHITFLHTLFFQEYSEFLNSEDKELNLGIFCIIHQLEGKLDDFVHGPICHRTIEIIRQKNLIFPQDIINFIEMQDELVSGLGAPKGLSAQEIPAEVTLFSVINRFERIKGFSPQHSKRQRLEKAIKEITNKNMDYDPIVVEFFIKFLKKLEI